VSLSQWYPPLQPQRSRLGHEIATATGFVFVWRSLGQVFGVGLSSAVYQFSLSRELQARLADPRVSGSVWGSGADKARVDTNDAPQIVDELRHASRAIFDLPPESQALARAAFRIALRNTFIFGLLGALVVFATALFVRRIESPDLLGANLTLQIKDEQLPDTSENVKKASLPDDHEEGGPRRLSDDRESS
jgi:hypothetical protein